MRIWALWFGPAGDMKLRDLYESQEDALREKDALMLEDKTRSKACSVVGMDTIAPSPAVADDAVVAVMGMDVPGDESNARLIAAAPDLLAALLSAKAWLDMYGQPPMDFVSRWLEVTETVDAAISKAEAPSPAVAEPAPEGRKETTP